MAVAGRRVYGVCFTGYSLTEAIPIPCVVYGLGEGSTIAMALCGPRVTSLLSSRSLSLSLSRSLPLSLPLSLSHTRTLAF